MKLWRLVVLYPLITTYSIVQTKRFNAEFWLKKDLFGQYRSDVRPVTNYEDVVNVTFEVGLQQIVEVNEKSEYLSLSCVFRQFWNDSSLQWTPEKHTNITEINVTPGKIWKPDIVFYNNIEKSIQFGGALDRLKNRAIIKHHGNVKWLTLGIISGKCSMDISYFPFDTQKCKLKFGLWSHNGHLVDIHPKDIPVDLSLYTNHSEWTLVSAIHKRNVEYYSCCTEPYPDITVEIVLKRRPLFYVLNLILPMVLVALLTLLSFYLPAESGERVSFAVTLLLAMTVFMLIVADLVPASSETIPLLGVFFTAVMVEMVLMVLAMCYILKLHLKCPQDGERIGLFLRRIVYEYLAVKLRVRSKCQEAKKGLLLKDDSSIFGNNRSSFNKRSSFKRSSTNSDLGSGGGGGDITNATSLLRKNLQVLESKRSEEEMDRLVKYEYEVCAKTLDIVALFVFVGLFLVILVIYLACTL